MSGEQASALQSEILTGIPLSKALGFRIAALDNREIRVEAPLEPNLNVHSTGFAGSLYALGILTAWGITRHLIVRHGLGADLVVADAAIRYRAPVRDDIVCHCVIAEAQAAEFVRRLESDGRSRLAVEVSIGNADAATLGATMVATTPVI